MRKTLIGWMVPLAAAWLVVACGESAQVGDTQTNWLKTCTHDAECGPLSCVCGVCTEDCAANDCGEAAPDAVCFPAASSSVQSLCASAASTDMCLVACVESVECGSDQQCLAGACVPNATPPLGSDDASGFCQLWVDRFAAYVETCGCGAEAAQRYRDQALCGADGAFGGLAAAVERGDLVYDRAAADALFARLEADSPVCVEEPFRALGLDSLELYSFAGVFTGTHALGAPCTSPVGYKGGINDCREGVCAADGAGGGVCVALVGLGEECDASGDENLIASVGRVCHDTRPSDSDGEYESAFDALSCVPLQAGAPSTCAQGLADGLPCESDEACGSGRCDGAIERVCQPKSAAGQPCSSSDDCLAGACRHDQVPAVCGAALLADGLPCSFDDAACASGSCSDDVTGSSCGPAPSAAIGSACSADQECVSSVCRAGLCFADICGDYLD